MSALIAPATQAALLPSGNVEATDPAYELDFTGDHKYQGGTVTFTQDEISFRGDAFEIAKDAAPTMLNGEGKIFFIELGHLTIGESTAPQAFKLVGNNIEIFISDTSLTPTAQSTLDIKATGYVKLHGGSILNPSATQLVGEPPVSVTSQINIEAAEILLDGYIPGKAVIDAADGHTISLTSKGNLSIKGDEAIKTNPNSKVINLIAGGNTEIQGRIWTNSALVTISGENVTLGQIETNWYEC